MNGASAGQLVDADAESRGVPQLSAPDPELWNSADADPWVPSLPRRGHLLPVRTVLYLARIPGGPAARGPLKVELSPTEDGGFDLFVPVLSVGGIGPTLEQALADLTGTLLSLWEELNYAPADSLAPDAALFVERLRSVFVDG